LHKIQSSQMKKVLIFLAVLSVSFAISAQTKIDSLLRLCEKSSEKQKSGLYLELSFISRKDTSKSNSFSRMAYKLAVKNKQISDQAKSFYYLGETDYYSRDYAKAIPFYEKAISLYKLEKDTFNLTNCHNSIGLCYHYMDQGEKAISQFIEGLKLCGKDQEYAAEIISNIGMAHEKMQNLTDAINNYRKALKINISIKDSASIAVNYNGIGSSYVSMNKNDSAIVNFNKALHLFKKMKRIDKQAIVLSNLASVYPNYPDSLNQAIEYFNQSLAKFKELGLNHFEAEISAGIASVYCKQGKLKNAIAEYNESLRLTDLYNKGFYLKMKNYEGLWHVYEIMKDFKMAFKYHILFSQYSDSLDKKEKYQQIVNLEKKYETEKKENEIIRLQAKQQLTDIQLSKNKQLKLLGFITAIMLLFIVFYVLQKYSEKIKSNKLLEEKNLKIEQSEQELRVLNASKNKFFSIIAHDLKNPFHTVMGYSWLLSKDYDLYTEEERRKFALDINQSTNNIFRLLQNLLEWSRSQTGRLEFTPLEIEFKRVLENSVSVLRSLADQKNINITTEYSSNLILFADPLMIETVLRNLITNAIKFTPENGQIIISAHQANDHVCINIRDTGVGISEVDIQNLFKIDSKVKRKGTNNEDGSGLGLILCKEFVNKNNGTIWAESTPGKGSSFSFTIPAKANASNITS